MIPESVPSCLRAKKQPRMQASRFARSAQRGQAARSSATCRVAASADGATVARTSTHGSWAPHLYDAHCYHEHAPEHVPTLRAVPESGITDEGAQMLMGVAFVLLPLMLAAWGWSM